MVRLTAELIAKGTSGYTKKKKEESAQQFAKRLTHLYLENKNITEVVMFGCCFVSQIIELLFGPSPFFLLG